LGEDSVDKRHIVMFYGNYTHLNTANIIMERANEGSLEDYFQKHPPPSESEDIRKFWFNLYQILKALHHIHYVEQKLNGHLRISKGFVPTPDVLSGISTDNHRWHQDVKPENIFVFSNQERSPYEFTFKLADFGTSHFKKMTDCGVENTATGSYGTLTYGMPENPIYPHRNILPLTYNI
jgi:serine/threonine protein kinase